MTIIVYRDGILAADTAVWTDKIITGYRKKITRLSEGRLYAASAGSSHIYSCQRWLEGGERPAPVTGDEYFSGILINCEGIWCIDDTFALNDVSFLKFVVLGSSTQFVLGALAQGASAIEAVDLAILFTGFAGGEVQWEQF